MNDIGNKQREKESTYPVFIGVRISKRQASDIELVKSKTTLSDSDIVREALQLYLNETIHNLMIVR